jgi:hypothetical protein
MMDYIITTLAVMTGTLLASGLAVAVLLNKKVIKAYVKHVNKVSKEITEEMIDKL